MKIANTSLERSASLVFIRKLRNKLNALQLHWRLPNSARNLAEAEFGKNGRISNLPKPKFGATLNVSDKNWITTNISESHTHTHITVLMFSFHANQCRNVTVYLNEQDLFYSKTAERKQTDFITLVFIKNFLQFKLLTL